MAFTDDEKASIRHHLGFLNVGEASVFILGVPGAVQTQFQIEGAMDRVLPAAEAIARRVITQLDEIEKQMGCNVENAAVNKLGNIELRADAFPELTKQYDYWRKSLANIFGVPPNQFDQRFGGGGGINVPVHN